MPEASYWLVKLLIALPGALVGWKSYQAYRRRRLDPAAPPNPAQDRWWRVVFIAGSAAVVTFLLTMIAPGALLDFLFPILGAAVLTMFVAAFALGWTSR